MSDERTLLTVTRTFHEIDLSAVNEHMNRIVIPKREEAAILELDKEPFPPTLIHLSLEDLLMSLPMLNSLRCSRSEATHTFRYGMLTRYCLVPERLQLSSCFVCKRPLAVFRMTLRGGLDRGGYCPMCHQRNLWREAAHLDMWGSMGDQPLEFESSRRWAHKFEKLVIDYVKKREEAYLDKWNGQERSWWNRQKKTKSEAYLKFLESWEEEMGLQQSQ